MTVTKALPPTEANPMRTRRTKPRVEPLIGLEWSLAIEQPVDHEMAARGSLPRRAWVHRAPERQVLALYEQASADDPELPAPWWLRALAAGRLRSRAAGFAVEDRVATLLAARAGWVAVPWAAEGETGYWEFMPSERRLAEPGMPTTLLLTDRHSGWIDIIPLHSGETPAPIAVDGLADLRANLGRFEALQP